MPHFRTFFLSLLLLAFFAYVLPNKASFAQSPQPSQAPAPTPSPSFPSSRALADYLYSYNQYRLADNNYVVAKNEYLTYGTLTSKQKALDATKSMLIARADVVRTYLLALSQTLLETKGVPAIDRDPITTTINTQVTWTEEQKSSIPSAGTLDDLVKISQKFEDKYPELEITFYTALTYILAGREQTLWQNSTALANSVKAAVLGLNPTTTKIDVFERWLLEAQARLDRAQDKHQEAISLLTKINGDQYGTTRESRAQTFSQIQSNLEQENIYLKEAISFLTEVIREAANAGI